MSQSPALPLLGWREWVALPEIAIPHLRAKIDTGAKTSSLHAEECVEFERDGQEWVRFEVVGKRGRFRCESAIHDRRTVRSSSGHEEHRPVITTECVLLGVRWAIELTLTDRASMRFPMLLGRQAMAGRFAVDPGHSYLGGKPPRKTRKTRKKKR